MVTVGQIPQAISTVQSLLQILNNLQMLLGQAKDLSDKNWQVDIGVRFPIVVAVTPAQQSALVGDYDTLKAQLVTVFQQLP